MKTKTAWREAIDGMMPMAAILLVVLAIICGPETASGGEAASVYGQWKALGASAAENALAAMEKAGAAPRKGNVIVLTNAGYAEVGGASTQGALDGLTETTGASRGSNTLIEIHSAAWTKLWFALYDKVSGLCSYMEVIDAGTGNAPASNPFETVSLERIDFEYLSSHADEYKVKFNNKVFGGNEFRIISIVNAVAKGAPAYAIRAFEFHDHYCPGVTSGIMMAGWLKKHFPPESGSDYFVQAIQPWCKEDALMVLLNTTPGKRSYSVAYPTDADLERLKPEAKDASTVVYRKKKNSENWEGIVLAFEWEADTQCPETGNGIVDKVCQDLWYLKHIGSPEKYVRSIKTFDLPAGVSPKDWAAPGVDCMAKIGLVRH
jgi:formylmethanofuran dehydrogenase subunit E-like metal-binding protein